MKAVSVSSLRKRLKEHLDYVSENDDVIIVPRKKDEDAVVIMSIREYNSIIETEHVLSSKANVEALERSIAESEAGKVVPYDLDE